MDNQDLSKIKEEISKMFLEGKSRKEVYDILVEEYGNILDWEDFWDFKYFLDKNDLRVKQVRQGNSIKNIKELKVLDKLEDKILLFLSRESVLLDDLVKKLDVSELSIFESMRNLEKLGYRISYLDGVLEINKNVLSPNRCFPVIKDFYNKEIKIGVVADTHFCSKHQQITHLHTFYEICKKDGVEEVLHSGDMVAGENVYRGQKYEIFLNGADAQSEYVIKNYPKIEGIKTYFIIGNHDEDYMKNMGVDIGKRVSAEREDMVYLGQTEGRYYLNDNSWILLSHPRGGGAYAKSYKLQKKIESLSSENKPNILIMGHYHYSMYMFSRNVHAIHPGCFESQTLYLKEKSLMPEVGGVIITINIEEDGSINRLKYEWIPFFKMIQNDW